MIISLLYWSLFLFVFFQLSWSFGSWVHDLHSPFLECRPFSLVDLLFMSRLLSIATVLIIK
jgi:hypothetical protein